MPPRSQRRSVVVTYNGAGHAIGCTQGFVRHAAGYFLFTPDEDNPSLLRQFVSHSAITSIEFGASKEERVSKGVGALARSVA